MIYPLGLSLLLASSCTKKQVPTEPIISAELSVYDSNVLEPYSYQNCEIAKEHKGDLEVQLALWPREIVDSINDFAFVTEMPGYNAGAAYDEHHRALLISKNPDQDIYININYSNHEINHHIYHLIEQESKKNKEDSSKDKSSTNISQWDNLIEIIKKSPEAECALRFTETYYVELKGQDLMFEELIDTASLAMVLTNYDEYLNDTEAELLQTFIAKAYITILNNKQEELAELTEQNKTGCDKLLDEKIRTIVFENKKYIEKLLEDEGAILSIKEKILSKIHDNPSGYIQLFLTSPELGFYDYSVESTIVEQELFARAGDSLMSRYSLIPTNDRMSLTENLLTAFENVSVNNEFIYKDAVDRYKLTQKLRDKGKSPEKIKEKVFKDVQPYHLDENKLHCFDTWQEYYSFLEEKSTKAD